MRHIVDIVAASRIQRTAYLYLTHVDVMEDTMQPADLTQREQRAVMLETQTPAYARSSETRRAIDLQYRRAANLRKAFRDARIDVPVTTRAIVPHTHKYVSGLNVPTNFKTVVGKQDLRTFNKLLAKAKNGLEARNA